MRLLLYSVALSSALALLAGCRPAEGRQLHGQNPTDTLTSIEPTGAYFMRKDGKLLGAPIIPDIYQPSAVLDTIALPLIDAQLTQALMHQLTLIEQVRSPKYRRIGQLNIQREQLRQTVEILLQWQHVFPYGIHHRLEAWQIRGEDRRGNVLFTGYFTPVVPVSSKPEAPFLYPIYDRPRQWEGPLPTRAAIEHGQAFEGLGLEIAYAADPLDIYFMQLQGSGFIEYPNRKRKYLAYNGTNRHPFRSIESFIRNHPLGEDAVMTPQGMKRFFSQHPHLRDSLLHQNPSYTFFMATDKQPEGAGGVPLTQTISVAVDARYIPLGACLVAIRPEYDTKSRKLRHRYAILLAQDTGGAIQGPGHLDFYTGIGTQAGKTASQLRHYGRVWLLLPRQAPPPANIN